MMPWRRTAVACLGSLALSAACAAVPQVVDPPTLDGTAWVLSGLPGRPLVPGSTVTLQFESARAGGSDGCNRYVTTYTTSGDHLTFGANAAATQMACAADVMDQAGAVVAALSATRSHRVVSGNLELLSADGALVARFAPQSRELAGTGWRVIGYNNGRQAVVSVLLDTELSMRFTAGGQVGGFAGCNNYTATYARDGNTLSVGPVAATRRMCATPEGVMEQEQLFLRALESVATLRMDGDRLELRTATGALAVNLGRGPAG